MKEKGDSICLEVEDDNEEEVALWVAKSAFFKIATIAIIVLLGMFWKISQNPSFYGILGVVVFLALVATALWPVRFFWIQENRYNEMMWEDMREEEF